MDWLEPMKKWLLQHKRVNAWESHRATAMAVYALCIGVEQLPKRMKQADLVEWPALPKGAKVDYAFGTMKILLESEEIIPSLSRFKIVNDHDHAVWGGLVWLYEDDTDQIESFEESPLKLSRQYFVRQKGDDPWVPVDQDHKLQVGDQLMSRLIIESDREMSFIYLNDDRAAGAEPLNQLSHHQWKGGLSFYQSPSNKGMEYFISFLPRGLHVLENEIFIQNEGVLSAGLAELKSLYAPEFTSHSDGMKMVIGGE